MTPTGVYGTDADGRDWTICDLGVPVDLVCDALEDLHPRFVKQQDANANLIAAAPDLYTLLEEAGEFIQPFNRGEELSARIYAALARARGEA